MKSFEDVAAFLRRNEVGRRASIDTPFGRRLLTYADLTATGRYLHFVEAWIRRVRPYYANSHTMISSTGRIMTQLREEARRVIGRSVNASAEDVVMFVGAGSTAAVNKLVGLLGLRISEPLEREYQLSKHIPPERRPVVFVGPYEHHSNVLPWTESVAEVVEISLDAAGGIDLDDLRAQLHTYRSRPLKIGAFSAASNVTGVLSDVRGVARVLHQGEALAVFDYAAAGPYVPIDMHSAKPEERIDAIFLSPHKFVGGPTASGVLVAHRDLFRSRTPERPGGGTVDYVSGVGREWVDYVHRLDEREEGGTPNIIGDLRAGIAFLVKEMIGPERLEAHEAEIAAASLARLSKHPRIRLLGPTDRSRLAILSFNIEGLHHDLVSVLLDHLFGIQNRSGCSCAGPYGHRLLGYDREQSAVIRKHVSEELVGIKPGWVRVSVPYYASQEEIDFLLRAVEFVADRGDAFVPAYRLSWKDGGWQHIDRPMIDRRPLDLTVDALEEAAQSFAAGDPEAPLSDAQLRGERGSYFDEARRVADQLEAEWKRSPPAWNPPTERPDVDPLIWFKFVHSADMPKRHSS